jgi:CRISPR-associated protein Csx1
VSQVEKAVSFATWGEPLNWRYGEYTLGNVSAKGFTTLHILEKVEKPEKVVVVALETLSSFEAVNSSEGFSDLEKHAREYVRKYLCGVSAEIEILPGILERREKRGNDQVYVRFRSHPEKEFKPLLLYKMFRSSVEKEASKIILDVSHGINFMPTLALEAAEECASMLAVAGAGDTVLKVYQSDPFLPGVGSQRSKVDSCMPENSEDVQRLGYNLILEKKFTPWDLSHYINYNENNSRKLLTNTAGCSLEGAESIRREYVMPILGAFRLGALVELGEIAKAFPLLDLQRIIESCIECWKNKRIVEKKIEENVLEVTSGTRFGQGFTAMLHAYAVTYGARKLLRVPLDRQGKVTEQQMSLEEIKKLRDLLKGSRIIKTIVDREVSKLEKLKQEIAKKNMSLQDWTLYRDVLQQVENEKVPMLSDDTFPRDFIGHAGFHTDVLEIRMEHDTLQVRVRPQTWEKVKKVLVEAPLEQP